MKSETSFTEELSKVQKPEFIAKIAILSALAERQHLLISEEVKDFIASNINLNVSVLEECINRLKAYAGENNRAIDSIFAAHSELRDIFETDVYNACPVDMSHSIKSIEMYLGYIRDDMCNLNGKGLRLYPENSPANKEFFELWQDMNIILYDLSEANHRMKNLLETIQFEPEKKDERSYDELLDAAWRLAAERGEVTVFYIQRKLDIGYNKAVMLYETLEEKEYIDTSETPAKVVCFPETKHQPPEQNSIP
ncbi:MAG: DnaA/Hda family protein [Sphaerochaetaceae bacterium]|nr:DnaA/Hda family protein [Sphaerochaetaceae bacterium]